MATTFTGKADDSIGVKCSTEEKNNWNKAFRHGELSRAVRGFLNRLAAKRLGIKPPPNEI